MKSATGVTLACCIALATAQDVNTTDASVCASGAHVIVARASLEAPGYGILGTVKDQILQRIPNSNAVAVPYPAQIFGPVVYVDSEPEGVGNLSILVNDYVKACPGRPMVLMGYSQGAQVVGDALIGSDYPNFGSFPNTTGFAQNIIDSIAAVIMMGDPANVAGQPILKGNSTHNGDFPRANTNNWVSEGLVSKVVSYCDAGDLFCDSGDSLAVHLSYIDRYGSQAVDFVVQQFSSANASASASSSTASASSTGSPSKTSGSTSASTTSASQASTASSSSSTSSSSSGASSMTLNQPFSSYLVLGALQCIMTLVLVFAL